MCKSVCKGKAACNASCEKKLSHGAGGGIKASGHGYEGGLSNDNHLVVVDVSDNVAPMKEYPKFDVIEGGLQCDDFSRGGMRR
jgi:hypothetical protein